MSEYIINVGEADELHMELLNSQTETCFGYPLREKITRCRNCIYKRDGWNGKRPDFFDWFFCAYWGGHQLTDLDGFCKWGDGRE